MSRSQRWALAVLSLVYAVGAISHLVPFLLPWMIVLTPWFLWLAGGAVVAFGLGDSRWTTAVWWFVPVFLLTFALEVLGVATGRVFGPYHYTEILGVRVFDVPPVIGFNWVLVVWGAHNAVKRLVPHHTLVRVGLVALVCVGFDLLLEPVAIKLGYWVWEGGSVPLQNYVAWGLIAAAAAAAAERFRQLPAGLLLSWYLVLQAGFFAVVGLWGPAP